MQINYSVRQMIYNGSLPMSTNSGSINTWYTNGIQMVNKNRYL